MSAAIGGNSGYGYFSSASGLRDASLRMDVVANNVANANTNGFVPQRVDSQADRTGGVRGLVVEANAGMLADSQTASQTDISTEMVNLTLARRAFAANLKASSAQHAAEQRVIDAIG